MGQRLNVEIMKDKKVLANCYFHWSAYTSSSLSITKELVDHYLSTMKGKITDPLYSAVKLLLQNEGSGLSQQSLEFMNKNYPDETWPEATSRNDGLIACVNDEIEETEKWEEGRVVMDLDDETIDFDVLFEFPLQDADDYFEEDDKFNVLEVPMLNIPLTAIPFKSIEKVEYFFNKYHTFVYDDEELIVAMPIE